MQIITRDRHRRGIALILVVIAIAAAGVVSLALLGSSSLQASVSRNVQSGARADGLAASGINLAVHYLANPADAGLAQGEIWPGQDGITFGAESPGHVDVSVDAVAGMTDVYDITARGTVTDGATTIERRAAARVAVIQESTIPSALSFNGNLTIRNVMTINGDIKASGSIGIELGATVNGKLIASTLSNLLQILFPGSEQTSVSAPVPTSVPDYRTYRLTPGGTLYSAQLLPPDPGQTFTTLAGVTLNADPMTNPAGIFYAENEVRLAGSTQINGTLLVRQGRLTLTGGNNTVNPRDGFPAIVVSGADLRTATNAPNTLTANGLVYLGAGITRSGTISSSRLTINGGLQIASGGVSSTYNAPIQINYVGTRLKLPLFATEQDRGPTQVRMVSYRSVRQ